jgi:hypothetical protein
MLSIRAPRFCALRRGALPNAQIRPGRRSVSQRFSLHPSSPRSLGCTLFSRVASARSSLQFRLVYFRQPELESIEEDVLVVGRLGEARFANLDATTSRQDESIILSSPNSSRTRRGSHRVLLDRTSGPASSTTSKPENSRRCEPNAIILLMPNRINLEVDLVESILLTHNQRHTTTHNHTQPHTQLSHAIWRIQANPGSRSGDFSGFLLIPRKKIFQAVDYRIGCWYTNVRYQPKQPGGMYHAIMPPIGDITRG